MLDSLVATKYLSPYLFLTIAAKISSSTKVHEYFMTMPACNRNKAFQITVKQDIVVKVFNEVSSKL